MSREYIRVCIRNSISLSTEVQKSISNRPPCLIPQLFSGLLKKRGWELTVNFRSKPRGRYEVSISSFGGSVSEKVSPCKFHSFFLPSCGFRSKASN